MTGVALFVTGGVGSAGRQIRLRWVHGRKVDL
jgi:hypothetical protein